MLILQLPLLIKQKLDIYEIDPNKQTVSLIYSIFFINYIKGNVIGFPNNKDQVNKSPRSEDMLGQKWPLS